MNIFVETFAHIILICLDIIVSLYAVKLMLVGYVYAGVVLMAVCVFFVAVSSIELYKLWKNSVCGSYDAV